MALQHLRSSTANKRPLPAGMSDGQLAINTNATSPGLFFKDSNGNLVKSGPVHVGTTAPNASPASGGATGNSTGELWLDTSVSPNQLKTWNGSAWVSDFPDEIPVAKLADGAARQLLQTDAAGTGVEWTSNVDVPGTLDVTGATTLDSTLTVPLGSAVSPTLQFIGDTNTGIYSPGADQLALSTNSTERLRIDSTGQIEAVSLGTAAAPTFSWTGDPNTGIYSPGADQVAISTNGAEALRINSAGDALFFGNIRKDNASSSLILSGGNGSESGANIVLNGQIGSPANTIQFRYGSTESMRIDSSGRVGIGTSSPGSYTSGADFVVANSTGNGAMTLAGADAGSPTIMFKRASTPSTTRGYIQYDNTSEYMRFATNGGERLRIDSSGRVGIGTTGPNSILHAVSSTSSNYLQINGPSSKSFFGYETKGTVIYAQDQSGNASPLSFNIGGSEAARFDSSSRLLVGTSTDRSGSNLQVEGTSFAASTATLTQNSTTANAGATIRLGKSRGTTNNSKTVVASGDRLGNILYFGADGSSDITAATIEAFVDGTPGSNDMPGRLVFSTTADGASSPTEHLRIDKYGSHAIYSTVQAAVLSTNYAASASNVLLYGRHSATAVNGGTDCIYIRSNGNVQNTNNSYGAISDIKLKANIVDANSQWDDIKSLQVRNYNFKEGQTHTQIGLIAQEVELVSPGLVSESPDRDEDGNDLGTVTKSVNYSVLYMKAVKALQEAMERIETLEASNTDLLARVSALESA